MERFYVNGNAVRKIEAEPLPNQPVRRQDADEEAKRKRRQYAARRNRERALRMSRGYVLFLSFCVLVSAFAAGSYVMLQAQITRQLRSISSLESLVTDLKADNDANYKRIVTSVDLDYIKDVAMNQLGMDYASEDQVIYYTVENNDYMNQYSDIPK